MRISVAMATFNGERHLDQQLESLRRQTWLPDELVVCDDQSTDQTIAAIERFAAHAPFAVRLHRNSERLGFPGNFEKAISLCEGDLIFFCDQDDYWEAAKVERVVQAFREHPNAWLVLHDAALVNQDLEDSGLTLTAQLKTAGLDLDEFFWGCCMAIRGDLRPFFLPFPVHLLPHDTWIHFLTLALGRRFFIHEVLIRFRRHSSNTSQSPIVSTEPVSAYRMLREKLRWRSLRRPAQAASAQRIEINREVRKRLAERGDALPLTPGNCQELEAALFMLDRQHALFKARAELQAKPFFYRFAAATGFLLAGRYKEFEGWKSWIRDILG